MRALDAPLAPMTTRPGWRCGARPWRLAERLDAAKAAAQAAFERSGPFVVGMSVTVEGVPGRHRGRRDPGPAGRPSWWPRS